MRLITGISIRGLRSIQNGSLDTVGALTALVGRNSSGKSNLLRALNLFFNDEIEPGKRLLLQRDYHSRPQARRRKEVRIEVSFVLPTNFRFRKSLAPLRKAIGQEFSIRRTWGLDERQAHIVDTELLRNGQAVAKGEEWARQFLQLVTFRYIPNRTVPAALLRDESRDIASSIFAKMHESGAQNLLAAMKTAADRLLKRAAESMDKTGAPMTQPSIASPESLADLLSVSGFQARGVHGNVVRDEEWGSGNQAFFLYEVLQAIDTNYSRSFGWKQAAIWGVEEPESGLHRDLETRLADEFRTWCTDPSLKLQIIQTTHSPIFTMASDVGYWVDISDGASTLAASNIPSLVRDAERRGVSGWVQPILAYPTNPVVLVEGTSDAEILAHVAAITGFDRLRFLALSELDAAERGGGKDAIAGYIRKHGGLLGNRPKEAPLMLLFDWDVSNEEVDKARKAYGTEGAIAVLRMNPAHCDPQMSEDFRGIERFFPPRIIREAASAGDFVIGDARGKPLSISASQLSIAKQRLRSRIRACTQQADLPSLVAVVRDIDTAVTNMSSRQLVLSIV